MTLFLFLILAVPYFLPMIVALARGHRQKVPIALLNLFLGWTLIGWVAALVWSVMRADAAPATPAAPVAQP